jgi:hypothetical protein
LKILDNVLVVNLVLTITVYCGDHIQTCQRQCAALPAHEWIAYRLRLFLLSVGPRVETHRITPSVDNERGDIEIQDYVILSRGEDDRFPPRTLVMDVTMSHDRYGRTTQHTNGTLTHRVSSTGSDGVLRVVVREKILHHHQLYIKRPDPVAFMPVAVDTSCLIYDDFSRLLILHTHRVSVGLILTKVSTMRISTPFDLSSWSFIPLPCFIRSRLPTTILAPCLVFCSLCST